MTSCERTMGTVSVSIDFEGHLLSNNSRLKVSDITLSSE